MTKEFLKTGAKVYSKWILVLYTVVYGWLIVGSIAEGSLVSVLLWTAFAALMTYFVISSMITTGRNLFVVQEMVEQGFSAHNVDNVFALVPDRELAGFYLSKAAVERKLESLTSKEKT
jgi:hypothetical protein